MLLSQLFVCVQVNGQSLLGTSHSLSVVNVCVQVNGQSLLGTSHQEAVRALQNLSSTVTLLTCDGYNGHNVTAGKPAGGLSTQVCTPSQWRHWVCRILQLICANLQIVFYVPVSALVIYVNFIYIYIYKFMAAVIMLVINAWGVNKCPSGREWVYSPRSFFPALLTIT